MLIPDADHPITITPTDRRVTVRVGDRVIAESNEALSLAEADYPVVQYIPLGDVDENVLEASDTVTTCPYKGDASYYDIAADGSEHPDAVWVYRTPHAAVIDIAGHAAFDPQQVEVQVAGA